MSKLTCKIPVYLLVNLRHDKVLQKCWFFFRSLCNKYTSSRTCHRRSVTNIKDKHQNLEAITGDLKRKIRYRLISEIKREVELLFLISLWSASLPLLSPKRHTGLILPIFGLHAYVNFPCTCVNILFSPVRLQCVIWIIEPASTPGVRGKFHRPWKWELTRHNKMIMIWWTNFKIRDAYLKGGEKRRGLGREAAWRRALAELNGVLKNRQQFGEGERGRTGTQVFVCATSVPFHTSFCPPPPAHTLLYKCSAPLSSSENRKTSRSSFLFPSRL